MAMVTVAHAQLRIGAKFGLTVANQQVTLLDGNSTEKDFGGSHPTFHFGVVTELPLAKKLWLRPELLFSGKGSRWRLDNTYSPSYMEFQAFYIEIPVNLVYRHTYGKGDHVFIGAGPSLAYGVAGEDQRDGIHSDFFHEGRWRNFDLGLNMLAGVELRSGIFFSVNFTPGLFNIADKGFNYQPVFDGATKWRNSAAGVSVGYMFKR